MKTSVTQFEILVNFMEKHGDINKPCKNARGRIQNIKDWENVTNILNSDAAGESKTTEKWKKVWSDLKNNTKKKAAKINRAACGTGGGPASNIKLTDLEERVLTIMGPQAATGLVGVVESGLSQVQEQTVAGPDTDRTITLSPTPPRVLESPTILTITQTEGQQFMVADDWNVPGTSHQVQITPVEESALEIPPPTGSPTHQEQITPPPQTTPHRPAHRGRTPRRQRATPLRRLRSPRRRLVGSHIEEATRHFLSADEEWRNFLKKKHEDEMEVQRERIRVRELEVEAQRSWQDIARCAIATLNKIATRKYL